MIYLKLYWIFFRQQIKSMMEYKNDFLMGIISVFVQQIGMALSTIVIFTQLKSLAGFSIDEIFLMYGFYMLVRGIDHFYNDNIWSFAWNKIRDGRFIIAMLRPINPLLYIVIERTTIEGIGEIFISVLIILYARARLSLTLNLIQFTVLLLFIFCGLAVYFSIKLLFSAPAFWTTCCGEFMTAGFEMSNCAKYPIELYKNKIIKNVLLFAVPFPISAYFPTVYWLNRPNKVRALLGLNWLTLNSTIIYSVAVSALLLIVSLSVWNLGLRRYEPTGT